MKENIIACEDAITRFCRLQMNIRRELPIRASEMGVLIYVEKSDKEATPLMISNFFGIAKPSVTDMVNSLVNKDYLVKIPSIADKRSYTLGVTPKGEELLETTYKEYFIGIELLEEKMGYEEFKLFTQLLQKANQILSEER
ncbi:MarR family winged helix-turn-helix transcriptional regulator [Clostridium swellfunianum]|uniref:MarR family winged helix-turn-helix transcriptional regulator n=1 Tax=Clostridium swellfunianum TaxID=1367462 RepID=UPI00202DE36E|nr:MarR family winged helix-turn-helix transcriptional regulator [Clostridium swellfunianum]MCM0650194.1 MarR family winged helix-turn-helix transcriptional regulator [Clostridium swellfunianum]